MADNLPPGRIEVPIYAQVYPAYLVLRDRFLAREFLRPRRADHAFVIDGQSVKLVGHKRDGDLIRRLFSRPAKFEKQAVPKVAWPDGYAGKFGVKSSAAAPAVSAWVGLLPGAPSGSQNGSPTCFRTTLPSPTPDGPQPASASRNRYYGSPEVIHVLPVLGGYACIRHRRVDRSQNIQLVLCW